MFFLRCAFWLTIVYASMSWREPAFGPLSRDMAHDIARLAAQRGAVALVTEAQARCAHKPDDCARALGELRTLLLSRAGQDAGPARSTSSPARSARLTLRSGSP